MMNNRVYVWDLFVRVFHWSLVLLFVFSYLTGEDESEWHVYAGYAITALVGLRILWGLVGSRYARFSDFVYAPGTIISYAKSMLAGRSRRYLGHNPLGGIMVVTLLASLLLTTVSGMKLYAVEEGKGPLAAAPRIELISTAQADDHDYEQGYEEDDEGEEFWEEVHEAGVNLMLFLIVLHLLGVALSSRMHNESLVKSMLSGYKQGDKGADND